MTLSVIENHQKDSDQDWKDTNIDERGDAKLRATEGGKIIVPSTSQHEHMDWHHENLKYPSRNRMFLTTKQHFCCERINNSAKINFKNYETCQLNKMPRTNYGKLPMEGNVLEIEPWKKACVDAIGPCDMSVTEH